MSTTRRLAALALAASLLVGCGTPLQLQPERSASLTAVKRVSTARQHGQVEIAFPGLASYTTQASVKDIEVVTLTLRSLVGFPGPVPLDGNVVSDGNVANDAGKPAIMPPLYRYFRTITLTRADLMKNTVKAVFGEVPPGQVELAVVAYAVGKREIGQGSSIGTVRVGGVTPMHLNVGLIPDAMTGSVAATITFVEKGPRILDPLAEN